MNPQLISAVEKYRVETEAEAQNFIDEQKKLADTENFELKKYLCEKKEKKAKGEVIEEYYVVTITKSYE